MTKRSRTRPEKEPDKLREDVNETAFKTVQAATGQGPKPIPPEERTEEDKNSTAQERGSKGGKKGGKARAEKLTDEQRVKNATRAALARWKRGD